MDRRCRNEQFEILPSRGPVQTNGPPVQTKGHRLVIDSAIARLSRFCRLCVGLFAVAGLILSHESAFAKEAASRPNVVLIISDDQAWNDYGFMGHKVIRTPRLDRLASESALFTRGYVATSLCRPSLASIITGLYAHQHRIIGNDPSVPKDRPRNPRRDPAYLKRCDEMISLIDKVPTLPRLLSKRGYLSHQSGKWWEGDFSRGGFTHGMTHGDPARKGRHGDEGLKIGREGMEPIKEFIDAAGERPFFVWYAPFLPHNPHNPPERLLAKYRSPDRHENLSKYYAMCEWFDETCGELLDHLDRRGLTQRTLVIYITDNGWIQRTPETPVPPSWRWSYAPRSKLSPYDAGARTPVMLRWPGKIQPAQHQGLVTSLDIAPTILSACGIGPAAGMSGIDLLEVCAGKAKSPNAVFGELFAHDVIDIEDPSKTLVYRWCVTDRWKLILPERGIAGRYDPVFQRGDFTPELFDIRADPFETRDLAASHPDVVSRLKAEIDAWWRPGGGQSAK